jgi:predicted ribosomally synthesized peptide with nif11-like leader
MSERDAQRFMNALGTDAELQQKVADLNPTDEAGAASSLVEIGGQHGYQFTAEELQAYVPENKPAAGELRQEELEHVAGGIALLVPAVQTGRASTSSRGVKLGHNRA